MRLAKLVGMTLCFIWAAAAMAAPIDLKGKTLKEVFTELLPAMGAADETESAPQEKSGKPESKVPSLKAAETPKSIAQQRWQEICWQAGTPGNEEVRLEACKLMAEKLDSKTPDTARLWLLRQLERIGRAECVDAVAAVLDDKDDHVREAAVRCLANNPAPQATAKLLAKLPTTKDKTKVGVLNALGYRGDKNATDEVAKELTSTEPAVAVAAARVLGKLGTPEAAKALAAAQDKAKDEVRLAIGDAHLLCADKMLKEGKAKDAAVIYKELSNPQQPRPVRLAALRGMLDSAGEKRAAMIAEMLAGSDRDAKTIAATAKAEDDAASSKTTKPKP